MLKKELRLKKEKDFSRVYKKGAFVGGAFFNINFLPNRTHLTRIGVVISKKTAKKAVERNEIKRKTKEALRELYPEIQNGQDIIVNIKKEVLSKGKAEIKREIEGQLRKKELLKK